MQQQISTIINKGIVYLVVTKEYHCTFLNQTLQLENVIFDNNAAEYGAGIVISDHSTITFSKNSVVTFYQNTANNSSGAIFLSNFSCAIFQANCFVMLIITQQTIMVDPLLIITTLILYLKEILQYSLITI